MIARAPAWERRARAGGPDRQDSPLPEPAPAAAAAGRSPPAAPRGDGLSYSLGGQASGSGSGQHEGEGDDQDGQDAGQRDGEGARAGRGVGAAAGSDEGGRGARCPPESRAAPRARDPLPRRLPRLPPGPARRPLGAGTRCFFSQIATLRRRGPWALGMRRVAWARGAAEQVRKGLRPRQAERGDWRSRRQGRAVGPDAPAGLGPRVPEPRPVGVSRALGVRGVRGAPALCSRTGWGPQRGLGTMTPPERGRASKRHRGVLFPPPPPPPPGLPCAATHLWTVGGSHCRRGVNFANSGPWCPDSPPDFAASPALSRHLSLDGRRRGSRSGVSPERGEGSGCWTQRLPSCSGEMMRVPVRVCLGDVLI